jgi:hypothetical protein
MNPPPDAAVIVAGAVAWDNPNRIRSQLEQLPKQTLVVHGDSPDADVLAGVVESVTFAVYDCSKAQNVIGVFRQVFSEVVR